MNIHIPSIPPVHRLTEAMLCDVFYRPVDVARFIWPEIHLDWFQRVRLKRFCLTPRCIDLSGVSTGKTIVIDWIWANLRLMFLTNLGRPHTVGVIFPTGGVGKSAFLKYFERNDTMSPMMRSQMRDVSEVTGDKKKSSSQQPDAFFWYFKGGGRGEMPNPSKDRNSENMKSRRWVDLIIDEASAFDAGSDAIDKELLFRASEATFNDRHPVTCNHVKIVAHAEPEYHPFTSRFRDYRRRWLAGDPNRCVISFSFKDWSQRTIPGKQKTFAHEYRGGTDISLEETSRGGTLSADDIGSGFGLIATGGSGYFNGLVIDAAVERGRQLGLTSCLSVHHVRECLARAEAERAKAESERPKA